MIPVDGGTHGGQRAGRYQVMYVCDGRVTVLFSTHIVSLIHVVQPDLFATQLDGRR
jgi:hypothetical protein